VVETIQGGSGYDWEGEALNVMSSSRSHMSQFNDVPEPNKFASMGISGTTP
jgi:hypothetical protein